MEDGVLLLVLVLVLCLGRKIWQQGERAMHPGIDEGALLHMQGITYMYGAMQVSCARARYPWLSLLFMTGISMLASGEDWLWRSKKPRMSRVSGPTPSPMLQLKIAGAINQVHSADQRCKAKIQVSSDRCWNGSRSRRKSRCFRIGRAMG